MIIPQNTPFIELRTIPVRLVEDDGVTPASIDTTGLKPQIRRIGTPPGYDQLDADLFAVSGVPGEYEVRLTQAEANRDTGNYRGIVPATGSAIQMPFTFQILRQPFFRTRGHLKTWQWRPSRRWTTTARSWTSPCRASLP